MTATKKRDTIAEIILRLVSTWDDGQPFDPYEINNGQCEDFAMALIEELGGYREINKACTKGLTEFDVCNFTDFGDLPSHVWVWFDGKHYDAECPEGVEDWRKLPLFAKIWDEPDLKEVVERLNVELDEKGWVKPEYRRTTW